MRTKAAIKKAAVPAAAISNKQQSKPYRKAVPLSSLKSEIGELLFCLEFPIGKELSQIGWGIFERWLRQYIDLIHTGGTA